MKLTPVIAILMLICAPPSWAQDMGEGAMKSFGEDFDEQAALDYSQAVIGKAIGDYSFQNTDHASVRLVDFQGKPLVISMIYTSCYHTCPVITQSLIDAVEAAEGAFGEDGFSVVTIGFDTESDTPGRMGSWGKAQGVKAANWHLLSADAGTIEQLSEDLGFIFYESPKGFDHLAQTSVLDGEGRVFRQVYGDSFDPPALVETLKDLIFGRRASLADLNGIINRIKLFCTIYDPRSARYHFDYSLLVGLLVGLLCLGAVGAFLGRELWRSARPGR